LLQRIFEVGTKEVQLELERLSKLIIAEETHSYLLSFFFPRLRLQRKSGAYKLSKPIEQYRADARLEIAQKPIPIGLFFLLRLLLIRRLLGVL
jgi:hypothetical protein